MIAVGGSLGGMRAVAAVLSGLKRPFPHPISVVLHRSKDTVEMLPMALRDIIPFQVIDVTDKEPIRPDHVYLAPADYHLLAERSCFSLTVDDPVCWARPSIDVLFESVAENFGPQGVGVLLTGGSRDGVKGADAILGAGGTIIIQDPACAECPILPQAAVEAMPSAHVADLEGIASLLNRLTDAG